ncbi:hypothetical protein PssvBMR5_gp23 [Pseudomonas phage MR5]|uniref:Uncharacterized protein n=1 Tax=Pseudomonas phage MR5 TaxID=2711172 RepID=A0A6M3TCP5_9CAUD|nr:hypothetical protein PssvBMR5_gp23 [Pseudomonas phage MR5]
MTWTVLYDVARTKHNQRMVWARCVCGLERAVFFDNIRKGRTKSCGCLKAKSLNPRAINGSPSPTYVSWQSMRTRCLNPNSADYLHYGGRGITICATWDSFEQFLADMGERPVGKTLDRINVDGNYCLDNCRWASSVEQRHNQRPHKRSVQCADTRS